MLSVHSFPHFSLTATFPPQWVGMKDQVWYDCHLVISIEFLMDCDTKWKNICFRLPTVLLACKGVIPLRMGEGKCSPHFSRSYCSGIFFSDSLSPLSLYCPPSIQRITEYLSWEKCWHAHPNRLQLSPCTLSSRLNEQWCAWCSSHCFFPLRWWECGCGACMQPERRTCWHKSGLLI